MGIDEQGGWRFPTPHEFFTFLFILVESARESGLFAPTSGPGRVLALLATACAVIGVNAAHNYVSPRVRTILEERDRSMMTDAKKFHSQSEVR